MPMRPGVVCPVQASPPKPGSQFSAELVVHGTVAASRLDYRCGDTVWSPARAPGRTALGRTAVLHQGRGNEPATETQKGVLWGWRRRPSTLRNHHAWGPRLTASPPLHKRRRHFGGELPGRCAVMGSLPPHRCGRGESSLRGAPATCATRISATKANQTSEVPPADSATPSSGVRCRASPARLRFGAQGLRSRIRSPESGTELALPRILPAPPLSPASPNPASQPRL